MYKIFSKNNVFVAVLLSISILLFSPTSAYALDFNVSPNPVVAGKPFTITVKGCSDDSVKNANITDSNSDPLATQWGPVFAYQEVQLGVGWTAVKGSFEKNTHIAIRQLILNDKGEYNFRFSCAGQKGKDPSSFSGQGEPDIHDYIGKIQVKDQADINKNVYRCNKNEGPNNLCSEITTAIGNIPVDPVGLASRLISILLGLSGGIFLLLIIRAGYRMIASQGNPEAIKDARESLTSAVVGFLFLIFSFVILELIGVHILQLPGFSQ